MVITKTQGKAIQLSNRLTEDFRALPCLPRITYGVISRKWYDLDFWSTNYEFTPEAFIRIKKLAYEYCSNSDLVSVSRVALGLRIEKSKVIEFHRELINMLLDGLRRIDSWPEDEEIQ